MTTTLELTGKLRASDAARLAVDIQAAFAAGNLAIETTSVTALECSVLQVLLSASRTAAQQNRNLRISAPAGGPVVVLMDRLAVPSDSLPLS